MYSITNTVNQQHPYKSKSPEVELIMATEGKFSWPCGATRHVKLKVQVCPTEGLCGKDPFCGMHVHILTVFFGWQR